MLKYVEISLIRVDMKTISLNKRNLIHFRMYFR